jgi:hypothetical protein
MCTIAEFVKGERPEVRRTYTYPDDRSDEFHQESWEFEKGRIEMVEEIDQQSLNVASIVILSERD